MQFDEINGPTLDEGNDTKVIAQTRQTTVGIGSKIFELAIWLVGFIPGIIVLIALGFDQVAGYIVLALGIIPGIVLTVKKTHAKNYFEQLQQKLQQDRSTIDNYIEQRVVILQNCAQLVKKSIDLDKDTFSAIAALRSGVNPNLSEKQDAVDNAFAKMTMTLENYPDLQAHKDIANAMQQNSYLQMEITAAREVYNSRVNQWNRDIFAWPIKQIVAAKLQLRTVVPFATSKAIKEAARGTFF